MKVFLHKLDVLACRLEIAWEPYWTSMLVFPQRDDIQVRVRQSDTDRHLISNIYCCGWSVRQDWFPSVLHALWACPPVANKQRCTMKTTPLLTARAHEEWRENHGENQHENTS